MTADNRLLLDNQLCFALYAASNAMTRLYRPQLERFGLTYPQYLVLLVLWESDNLTVSQLGDRLYLDSGTLTPLLKRMEGTGLIARRRDAADERQVRISLTPAGRALKADVAEMHAGLACLLPLEPDQLDRLRAELRGFSAALNDRTKE